MTILWDVAPCSLKEVYRRFRDAYNIQHPTEDGGDDKGSKHSETSANVYQTKPRNIPEDSQLHTRRLENLKSHLSHTLHRKPCSAYRSNMLL
jgi:hypothetical protein